ncbi:MAG: hypothetical protein QME21_05235 [Anaerolineales bacterium]|nr:hypothetical protein [Anaerolineales bacterium]
MSNESNRTKPTFTRAIVCKPAVNFAEGLTTQSLGVPSYEKALEQHAAYCAALRQCGLELIELPADASYPDSTFVEDTAILTPHCAILTHPGALSRQGEVDRVRDVLIHYYSRIYAIQPPGTLDGGDICEAGRHFFIGVSQRTNEAGALQLAEILAGEGYTSELIDIRRTPGILHLKSGIAYLGDRQLAVIQALANHPAFREYELLELPLGEEYAANCVLVNEYVLMAAGYPRFQKILVEAGHRLILLEMSEYQKMDGGLSCLSLRF